MRRPSLTIGLLVAAVLLPSTAQAWGERGHELVNELAAKGLPASAPAALRENAARLTYLGPEPDRWKFSSTEAMTKGTASDHYIDLELATAIDPKSPPGNRYEYMRKLIESGQQPDKVGLAPYAVVELCQRIEAAIVAKALVDPAHPHADAQRRQCDENLIHCAGVLGHYVGDLGNPHHTTIQFNGWTGDNPEGFATDRGTHARFESDFVERAGSRLAPTLDAPVRDDVDYVKEVWALVLESNGLVRDLYRLDKRGAFAEGQEDSEAGKAGVAFVDGRIRRAAALLRDLWVTACKRGERRARVEGLRAAVLRSFDAEKIEGVRVDVELDGEVKLRGRVSSPEVARRAVELAGAAPGAGRVTSRIEALY